MQKFIKPKRSYGKYKNKTYYLKQFYKLNKEKIDVAFTNEYTTSEKAFIKAVNETRYDYALQYKIESKMGRRKVTKLDALKYLLGKETFRSAAERFKDNLIAGIKKDKLAYGTIKSYIGKNKKINPENITYSKEEKIYFYDFEVKAKNKNGNYYMKRKRISIYLENSPEQIVVEEVEI